MSLFSSAALAFSFLFVYSYLVTIGVSYSLIFKQKFYCSLAPAIMLHVLLVLFCGMIFNKLSVGIYGGFIIAVITIVIYEFLLGAFC